MSGLTTRAAVQAYTLALPDGDASDVDGIPNPDEDDDGDAAFLVPPATPTCGSRQVPGMVWHVHAL